MRKTIAVAAIFFLVTGTAFAHTEGAETEVHAGTSAHGSVEPTHGPSASGSIHAGAMLRPDMPSDHAPMPLNANAERMIGIPGVVTSVGANSFVLGLPVKGAATSTVTVNVTSSTVFMHGSSTATLASLTSGTHVSVVGTFSTSTKSVAAERVMIAGEHMDGKNNEGVTKSGGFFAHIKNFFMSKHASTTDSRGRDHVKEQGSDRPAAAIESSFVGSILKAVFGWI